MSGTEISMAATPSPIILPPPPAPALALGAFLPTRQKVLTVATLFTLIGTAFCFYESQLFSGRWTQDSEVAFAQEIFDRSLQNFSF
jgi:hypothetical protein